MPLDDLRDFLDQPTLTLPIGGRTYDVTPCTAKVWLELQTIYASAATKTPKRVQDRDLFRMTLGDAVFDAMVDSDVTQTELRQAGMTALFWQLGRDELAEAYWRSGGKAPASEKNPEDPPKTETPTHTDVASMTPKRASRSTTSTRKKSSGSEPG